MPYRIFTYVDPYRIKDTDFWKDIKGYPQLCASRTLVNGLMSVMGDEIESLLCPLDDIVNKRVFPDWTENIGRRIQQYSNLGQIFSERRRDSRKPWPDYYYESLSRNKESMLDALRLFIELDIHADELNVAEAGFEHRVFAYLLRFAEKERLFSLPKLPSVEELITHFKQQAQFEKDEKERLHEGKEDTSKYQKELQIIDRRIAGMSHWDGKHVVIHGIHQFTPLQLRLITHMDKLGMDVIFLYNYIPKYREIYSSWDYIYQQFDAPIHHDTRVKDYKPKGSFQQCGMAIAENMALLCEERVPGGNKRIRENDSFYKDQTVKAFDNVSEYAGYVSDLFAKAETKLRESSAPRNPSASTKRVSTASVLARMDDVIYTANKDVEDLLQVYHPEYARNRHFLAYPIGQFFVSLYALWNSQNKEIDIDYGLLRNCVNSGILTDYSSWQMLKTLMNMEPLFAHIQTFSEFKALFQNYINIYKQVNGSTQATAGAFRKLTVYSTYKVPLKDIEELYHAVCEINSIASTLFRDMDNGEQFRFATHFARLREFVSSKQPTMVNEEEKDLIGKLITKLDTVADQTKGRENDDRKGTLDDLRAGLYFFLKQKEEPVSDWFVKNFEQIDGDVLTSAEQDQLGRHKVYHFACVSDKDMSCRVNDLLPWPLTDLFIERAYNPKDLAFQVYYSALGERGNFMRYALFYGLYFSKCETKISFVKHYGDGATDCYGLLKLIGLRSDNESLTGSSYEEPIRAVKGGKVKSMPYEREQMAAMMLCPYRYLFDYVLNPEPIFSGSFLMGRFFVNVLVDNTWKALQAMNPGVAKQRLSAQIDQEAALLKKYFPFLLETEIMDLKRQAENYIIGSSKIFNGSYDYNSEHMKLKKTFGLAKFYDDVQDLPIKHLYPAFEGLAEFESTNGTLKKAYSTHSVRDKDKDKFIACALDYLNNTEENQERPGSWCMYCADRNICLASYVQSRG